MITTKYLILMMIAMGGVTLLLRATPFVLLKDRNKPFIRFLGDNMPPGIMVILVFYSLTSISIDLSTQTVATLLSLMTVIIIHHCFRNPLLSIVLGTLLNVAILSIYV